MSFTLSFIESLSNARIVLVRPSHPGNIGATARAMQTMGLSRLVLVDPQRFPDPEAMAMAANAVGVLDGAEVCSSLEAALRGTVLQVAFSARARALSHAPRTPREAAAEVVATAVHAEVALVFGNETYGLSNDEVMRCNRLASIPTDPDSTSLNLAASVQVACYELRMTALDMDSSRLAPEHTAGAAIGTPGLGTSSAADTAGESGDPARHEDVERFLAHLESSLYASGFLQPGNPRRLMERMRRLYSRAGLQVEEVNILRGMLTLWDESGRAAKAPAAVPAPIVDKSTRK